MARKTNIRAVLSERMSNSSQAALSMLLKKGIIDNTPYDTQLLYLGDSIQIKIDSTRVHSL